MFSFFRWHKPGKRYKPVVLVILDGFGVSLESGNPYDDAAHPNFSEIEKWYPFMAIQASGVAVGIPWGEEGNSEIGHLTIGAGRLVYPALTRIMLAIRDGSFFKNPSLLAAKNHIKREGSTLHLVGLYSSGSVHSFASHLDALLDFFKREGISNLALHLITDGRDAPIKEAESFLGEFQKNLRENYPNNYIATIVGRSFAMERTYRWKKIEKVYRALVLGEGNKFRDPIEYIKTSYAQGFADESLEPGVLQGEQGAPIFRVQKNDAVVFFNHRADSMRELAAAFMADDFAEFPREYLQNIFYVTMTEYADYLPTKIAFKSEIVTHTLGEEVARAELKQLRVAEREKYAHITNFLNGGREAPFPKEDRIIVPSLEESSLQDFPEMSIKDIEEAVIKNIKKYDFIAVNIANPDMVGHTGNYRATVKAIEEVDNIIGNIMNSVLDVRGVFLITADHGNAEKKIYKESGEPRTKHSSNPVPFYLVGDDFKRSTPRTPEEVHKAKLRLGGVLEDVAPTILELLELPKPTAMTGSSLLTTFTRLV